MMLTFGFLLKEHRPGDQVFRLGVLHVQELYAELYCLHVYGLWAHWPVGRSNVLVSSLACRML